MRLHYFAFGFATNDEYCSNLEQCCCCSQQFAVSGNPRGCSRGSVVNVSSSPRVQTVNFSLRSFPRRQCSADLQTIATYIKLMPCFSEDPGCLRVRIAENLFSYMLADSAAWCPGRLRFGSLLFHICCTALPAPSV